MGTTAVITAVVFIFIDIIFPVKGNIEYGQLVRARDSSVLHAFLTSDEQWRIKANLNEITPELKKAIIYKEDKYFYYHPGVNLLAIVRAAFFNVTKQKRTSGASTITMQVARMLEPKERTYFNKLWEIVRALQLELHYTKEEILQMYLNLAPYGSNIQGVKAAAILYFDKLPSNLSLAEITTLSIIPNRPNSLLIGKHNSRIVKERNKWLLKFKEDNLFPKDAIEDAVSEPLIASRLSAPKKAPQLALRMAYDNPHFTEIFTTIDPRKQKESEAIVNGYMSSLKLKNIHNCAVIVINNYTHEVEAYIGSPDFFDNMHNGQVDGVSSARSPGSTLKPFLYALGIDKGYITPKTIIADVPINIDGYMPENYDLEFHGNITVEDALKKSLNIPAVKLLNSIGAEPFINILSIGGISSIEDNRKQLGLSLILGGCIVRLDELSALYSSFANNGLYHPLVWQTNVIQDSNLKAVRIVSKNAAYMTTNIITDVYRPDLPNLFDNAKSLPKIAWKTGTSYGRKDAWSIGYNQNYTIGVWVGNFNGVGVAELNGAGIATPLLFKLFNTIDKHASKDWLVQPDNINFRYVCKETGLIPNDYCTETTTDYFIPSISNNNICDHLKKVWLSANEDISYCPNCMPQSGYIIKEYPNISPDLIAHYKSKHIPISTPPPHNPLCTRVFEGSAPYITSLTNKATYIITDKGKQQLQLKCTASGDVKDIYWYINDKFYASTTVDNPILFYPEDRNIKISCVDDKGRSTDIRINIDFL
ncbi:MAG: penicillin-binding protein 1C [Flavipsychrobacter sp.]